MAIKALWMNSTIQEAINDYRLNHQLYPVELEVESGISNEIQKSLILKGQKLRCLSNKVGRSVVQAIQLDKNGFIYGYSDPRKRK